MADISTYLQRIRNAVYGEDVRDAIHDAIAAVNDSVSSGVPDNGVSTQKIQDGAVTGAKIANGAINGSKIEDRSITGDKIVGGGISDGSIIMDGTITGDKLADNTIPSSKLESFTVTASKIMTGAVSTKLFGYNCDTDYETLLKLLVPGYQEVLYLNDSNTDYYTIEHIREDVTGFSREGLVNGSTINLEDLIDRECLRNNDNNIRINDIKIINQYIDYRFYNPSIDYTETMLSPLPNYAPDIVASFNATFKLNRDGSPYNKDNQAYLTARFSKGTRISSATTGSSYVNIIAIVNYKHMEAS